MKRQLWTRGMPYFDAMCASCLKLVDASDDPVWIKQRRITTVLCGACQRSAKPGPRDKKTGKAKWLEIELKTKNSRR